MESYQPAEETIARLLDEIPDIQEAQTKADRVVDEADSGTALVRELNAIIEEYEESGETLDHRIEKAESAEELRHDVESRQEKALREASERFKEAREVLREADPEDVGEWGLTAGQVALPVVKASRFSTPMGILATMALGGMAGAYESGSETSILEEVDPAELRTHALAMAGVGKELEHIDGEAVGAILGTSSYLAKSMTPEEYGHWVTAADPEAILEGAELGAKMTQQLDSGSSSQGVLAGAGLGMMYGFTDQKASGEEFKMALDSDLYKEYLQELANNDIALPD